MNFAVIDAGLVVKLLLLLLIGMGPKVALVPFLEKTKHLDAETQRAVGRRMVATAVVTAIVLFATGWLLLRLLHLSGGAVAVGGAIVLAILAINMAAGPTKKVEDVVEIREDPKQIAVYPLAVPYLLNPVGITILIIASGEIVSFASAALVLGLALVQTFGINETNARDHCAAQAARTAFQTAGALLSLIRSLPSVN